MNRPLMWFCFSGMAIVFLIVLLAADFDPPPDYKDYVIVSGGIVKKEIRDERIVLYLKNCSVSVNPSSFEEDFPLDELNVNEYQMNNDASGKHMDNLNLNVSSGHNPKEGQHRLKEREQDEKIKGVVCYLDELSEMEINHLMIGARITLYGKLSLIEHATNPGQFDSLNYYRARGYRYMIYNPEILNLQGGLSLPEGLFRHKSKGCEVLLSELGEEYGGTLCAILFGDKTNLSEDVRDLYTNGGIAHVLAISGLHISLIGAFLYAILNHRPIPQWVAFGITVVILILYGYTVGLAPSVFRAVFMLSYRLLAKLLKKSYDALTALSLSAFLTCLIFPYMLLDSSFQLTYLAVFGILFVFPNFLPFVNRERKWWDGFLIAFSVFISTLPVMIYSFHQISLAGFLLNLFVLPAMPVLFVCAFGVIAFWGWCYPLAELLSMICRAILFTFSFVAEKMTEIPFTVISSKTPGIGRILIYTTFVVLLCLEASSFRRKMKLEFYRMQNRRNRIHPDLEDEEKMKKENKGFRIIQTGYWIVFGLLMLFACFFLLSEPKKPCISFLDVGQGDGIFIRTNDGTVIMIDGGSTTKKNVGERIIVPYLQYEGEREVDLWILSHEDEDHINGFCEVQKSKEVKIHAIAIPAVLKEEFREITEEAEKEGIEVFYLEAGDVVGNETEKDSYSVRIVSPDSKETYHDSNAASFAICFQEEELTVIFMSDAEHQAEEAVLEYLSHYGDGCVEILKCAHHGSANNTNTEDFITGLHPVYAVISCGKNNRYGHPHQETIKNLKAAGTVILRTDENGCITWK